MVWTEFRDAHSTLRSGEAAYWSVVYAIQNGAARH
jgi:hypothetical protein